MRFFVCITPGLRRYDEPQARVMCWQDALSLPPWSLECCGSSDWFATLVQVPLRFMIFPTLEYLSSPKIQVHGRHGSTAMTSSTIFNILHELDELPLGLDGLDVPRWLILSFGT